jgi:hypothetical protein
MQKNKKALNFGKSIIGTSVFSADLISLKRAERPRICVRLFARNTLKIVLHSKNS